MGSAEETRVVNIAVLTFHRVKPLSHLVPMLIDQAVSHEASRPSDRVNIIVIDNDPGGTGRAVVTASVRHWDDRHSSAEGVHDRVRYVIEPRPGISAGRNRALDESRQADLLVFIDDDETPCHGWLSALVAAHDEYEADVVSGPVVSHVAGGRLDPWVKAGGFFDRAHHLGRPHGSLLNRAASNNLLLKLDTVRSKGIRFDDAFGLTGGEDSLFTGRLHQAGASIRWAANAAVDDHLSAERLTREYALRRTFQLYNSSTRAELELSTSAADRVRILTMVAVKSVLRIAVGGVRTLVGVISSSNRSEARGRREIARGRGAIAALAGRHSAPYGDVSATVSCQ